VNKHLTVSTTIDLVRPEQGGRAAPVASGYRPAFVFEGDQSGYDGELELQGVDEALPGSRVSAIVRFLQAAWVSDLAKPNAAFQVREGNRIVGHGVVTGVLGSEFDREPTEHTGTERHDDTPRDDVALALREAVLDAIVSSPKSFRQESSEYAEQWFKDVLRQKFHGKDAGTPGDDTQSDIVFTSGSFIIVIDVKAYRLDQDLIRARHDTELAVVQQQLRDYFRAFHSKILGRSTSKETYAFLVVVAYPLSVSTPFHFELRETPERDLFSNESVVTAPLGPNENVRAYFASLHPRYPAARASSRGQSVRPRGAQG
jgi:hypothetical protein